MKKIKILLITLYIIFTTPFLTFAAEVKMIGERGNWQLLVDEQPFYIKGLGCGIAKGKNGEDYLMLAKELGANCVRTWGIDQGGQEYLDKAWEYGLMVDAGIWLKWPQIDKISYIGDSIYKREVRKEILNYIKNFKDHPAILMWNVGNEVLFFSDSEEERIAFCQFLEGLIKDIKQIDPNHPVIYASAAYLNLKYLKKYVPSLDMFGINAYCSIRFIHGAWDVLEIAKPYVITEYGPYLPNDSHRDTNGKPVELGDYQKAMIYRDYTEQIEGFAGYNLGGFAFHLGETSQESMTWWNLNEGESKKQSYWAIYAKYKDGLAPYQTPQIENLVISKVDNLMPNEIIDVEVRLKDAKAENFYFEYKMSTAEEGILKYYVNEYIDINVIGKGNSVKVEVPKQSGFYRLYCFVKDMNGNVSCMNKSISVSQINALKNK